VRLTRYTHACVRLEVDATTIVIDPGIWSEPGALLGADAVLLTHEHIDHVDELRLLGSGLPVWAPADARLTRVPFTGVSPGATVRIGSVDVSTHGGRHAGVLPDQQVCANVGYLVGGVYHPGDALAVPDAEVSTLLVPMQASWLSTSAVVEFARAVAPTRAYGIHDGQLNERGIDAVNHWLRQSGPYEWITPGTSVELP
jgi:L-ascorbate metabolism protein UlaG (beta-lactamase superfamily)